MPDRGCSYPPPTAGTSLTRTPERPTRSIYDLEDGVVPSARPSAREPLRRWFSRGGTGWIRINPAGTEDWSRDLDALDALPGTRGVMLAKCESAEQVALTAARLPAGTPILALVESALGIERATISPPRKQLSGSPSAAAISAATPGQPISRLPCPMPGDDWWWRAGQRVCPAPSTVPPSPPPTTRSPMP